MVGSSALQPSFTTDSALFSHSLCLYHHLHSAEWSIEDSSAHCKSMLKSTFQCFWRQSINLPRQSFDKRALSKAHQHYQPPQQVSQEPLRASSIPFAKSKQISEPPSPDQSTNMTSTPVPKHLNFITGNKNKLAEVQAILEGVIELRNQNVDLVEIQGTVEEVTLDKARRAAEAVRLDDVLTTSLFSNG